MEIGCPSVAMVLSQENGKGSAKGSPSGAGFFEAGFKSRLKP